MPALARLFLAVALVMAAQLPLTALALLALVWQPVVEPWALALIRSARQ